MRLWKCSTWKTLRPQKLNCNEPRTPFVRSHSASSHTRKEEMSTVLGRIVFERSVLGDAVRQNWAPSQLDSKQRQKIADVLCEIAEHIRNDEFENNGKYEKFAFPAQWTSE